MHGLYLDHWYLTTIDIGKIKIEKVANVYSESSRPLHLPSIPSSLTSHLSLPLLQEGMGWEKREVGRVEGEGVVSRWCDRRGGSKVKVGEGRGSGGGG